MYKAFLYFLLGYRLEPLLARILEKRSAVLCPMIDAIDDKTLEYSSNGGVAKGGFSWSLHFTWESVPDVPNKWRNSTTDPLRYGLLKRTFQKSSQFIHGAIISCHSLSVFPN